MTINQRMIPTLIHLRSNTFLGLAHCSPWCFRMTTALQRLVPWYRADFRWSSVWLSQDSLDIFDLVRVCCYPTSAFHASTNRGSWYYNHPLSLCPWLIPSPVYSKLAVSLLCRGVFSANSSSRWNCSNIAVLWLFLYLLYQVSSRVGLGLWLGVTRLTE